MQEVDAPHRFIFGYGNLISSTSRRRLGIIGDSIPVRVHGLERFWIALNCAKMRDIGVRHNPKSTCNGVLFRVSSEFSELELFDDHEMSLCYDHRRISFDSIDILAEYKNSNNSNYVECGNSSLLKEQLHSAYIWTYHIAEVESVRDDKTKNVPIAQSYIDFIIKGCEEISREFTLEFIRTTLHWNNCLNDRCSNFPLYNHKIELEKSLIYDELFCEILTAGQS